MLQYRYPLHHLSTAELPFCDLGSHLAKVETQTPEHSMYAHVQYIEQMQLHAPSHDCHRVLYHVLARTAKIASSPQ
jgi:hypothetical protein